jgi:hypothetical protein
MKLKLLSSLSAVAALLLVSCGGARTAGKPYPLATCVVSDEKLGSMGEPYVFVHEGQQIKLCCDGCLKDFKKEPAKYLAKLTAAPPTPVAPAK